MGWVGAVQTLEGQAMSNIKVAIGATSSAVVFTGMSAVALMGSQSVVPAGVTAITTLGALAYGYTAKEGTYRRGLLYGAAFIPVLFSAATAGDAVDRLIQKLRENKR